MQKTDPFFKYNILLLYNNQEGLQLLSPLTASKFLFPFGPHQMSSSADFDILTLVTGNMKQNGYEEIKRSKSLGDGLPQSRQRREERWRRRVSGFIQSAVGALKPEPAVESSQVSVTAVPCNHIRPGHTHN